MFDFILQKPAVNGAQKYIDRLKPEVNVHIPKDLPIPSVKVIKKHAAAASKTNGLEDAFEGMTEAELKAKTDEFKKKYQEGIKDAEAKVSEVGGQYDRMDTKEERESVKIDFELAQEALKKTKMKVLDEILPEAFAAVREAAKRVLGMRHYDIQLIGGMVLHNGSVAEMATGEGKTLVATCPAYLNALTGEGVHIITVNDYLAKRDRDWMGPIYEYLGLTVGVIQHDMHPEDRRYAYGCDVTYGTNNEFGFDYLRDNMVNFKDEMVQRPFYFTIADEVDSILIDEARTPLIISGPAEESTDKYYKANQIAQRLKGRKITEQEQIDAKFSDVDLSVGFDYIADEKARSISMTEVGEEKAAQSFGVDNLHEMETIEYRHHILSALKAYEFFRKDVDYVVRDKEVIIVDEFTGRMMPGRRWSDGLHQAVEAKEGIKIERENQTLATVTFQNYFRMYEKLAGMTGTAHTEATEFEQIYKLDTIVMPTNRPLQRENFPDCIYKTQKEKYLAVVEEIEDANKRGQPILVGTISIEKSELIGELLKQRGIPHQVLNAKFHEFEAQIVAQAGRLGAVTIATNMAGRGTDIVLGGNPEFLAKNLAQEKAKNPDDTEEERKLTEKFMEDFRRTCEEEHKKVVEAGGLYVMGTERHESRRIDNQLRGRSGRQGDPGASRFFVSLEDDLMRLFASDKIVAIMDKLGMEEGQVIEHPLVSRALGVAQKRVETHNFEIRKQLLEFDNVMNRQREVVYDTRRYILESDDVKERMLEAIDNTITAMVQQFLFSGTQEQTDDGMENWDVDGLIVYLKAKFGLTLRESKEEIFKMTPEEITEKIIETLHAAYEIKEREVQIEEFRYLEKILFLRNIDSKWKDHLYAMDQLKEGIYLRSYAQRDPIIEYKNEGYDMFEAMMNSIDVEVAETIFRLQPINPQTQFKGVFSSLPQQMVHDETSSFKGPGPIQQQPQQGMEQPPPPEEQPKPQPIRKDGPKVGRNEPCPCGSGKKYKKCCGQ